MPDRRSYPRLKIFLEAAYRPEGDDSHVIAQIGNLSRGGAALLTKEPIQPQTKIASLRFALPGKGGKTVQIDASGLAVHVSAPAAGRSHYLTGVDFVDLEDHELEAIQRFVIARLRRQAAVAKTEQPSARLPLEQTIAIRYGLFKDFVSEVSSNLSLTGMFIKTNAPRPAGAIFDFQFQLGDDFTLVEGRAEVVWARQPGQDSESPGGMGVRFLEIDQASVSVIEQLVRDHEEAGKKPFDLGDGAPESELPLATAEDKQPSEEASALPIAAPGEPGTEPGVDLQLRVRQLEDEAIRLRQDAEWQNLEQLKKEEELRSQLEQAKERVVLLEQELAQPQDAGPSEILKGEIEGLESARTELEEALLQARNELRETRAAVETERTALAHELDVKAQAYEEASAELEKVRDVESTLEQHATALEQAVAAAEQANQAATGRIEALEQERGALTSRLELFAAGFSELEREFAEERDAAETQRKELESSNKTTSRDLDKALSAEQALQERHAELEKRLAQTEGEQATLISRTEELEAGKTQAEQSLADAGSEHAGLSKRLQRLVDERAGLSGQLEELSLARPQLEKELEELRRELEQKAAEAQKGIDDERRKSERLLREAGNREKKLTRELETARRSLENTEAERQTLASQNTDLKTARREAARSLDKLGEEKQKLGERLASLAADLETRETADSDDQALLVSGLEKKNEEMAQSLAAAEQETENLKARVGELERDTASAEALREDNRQLGHRLAASESDGEILAARVNELETREPKPRTTVADSATEDANQLLGHPMGETDPIEGPGEGRSPVLETAADHVSDDLVPDPAESPDMDGYVPEYLRETEPRKSGTGWKVAAAGLLAIVVAIVGWRYFGDDFGGNFGSGPAVAQTGQAGRAGQVSAPSGESGAPSQVDFEPARAGDAGSDPDPAASDHSVTLDGSPTDETGDLPADSAAVEPLEPNPTAVSPAPDTTDAPGSGASDPADAANTVSAWAAAWSDQRVDDYLDFYDPEFQTPNGEPRAVWADQRRDRITRPRSILVSVTALVSRLESPDRAEVTFRQGYQSDAFGDAVTKTLELVRRDGAWKILAERSE